jgi:2-polyprenyl-3-methyl-5-hydroxy-6-metoxy-1,4-benzoquinol methylase
MTDQKFEFPELLDENRRIWDRNAQWWDDQIGDGNEFQTTLIEPATERLLAIKAGERILDIACGAGRFTRRMAELGAHVVAFDYSTEFIERARRRTAGHMQIEYHLLDAGRIADAFPENSGRFDKAVCTMALMDMPELGPMFGALKRVLNAGGIFVFSVTHPCFHSSSMQRFTEIDEEDTGRHIIRSGVKVSSYLSPVARKTEGIVGQPEPHWVFHRPIQVLFRAGFSAGFVVDGLEEPGFANPAPGKPGARWQDMPEIPPMMVVRMRAL